MAEDKKGKTGDDLIEASDKKQSVSHDKSQKDDNNERETEEGSPMNSYETNPQKSEDVSPEEEMSVVPKVASANEAVSRETTTPNIDTTEKIIPVQVYEKLIEERDGLKAELALLTSEVSLDLPT